MACCLAIYFVETLDNGAEWVLTIKNVGNVLKPRVISWESPCNVKDGTRWTREDDGFLEISWSRSGHQRPDWLDIAVIWHVHSESNRFESNKGEKKFGWFWRLGNLIWSYLKGSYKLFLLRHFLASDGSELILIGNGKTPRSLVLD